MTPRRRVIVADDNSLVREGLVHLATRSGFNVVGQACDGSQLIDLVRELVPDLVVVDTRMPPTWKTEGLQAAQKIREQFPSVGILVLSASVDVDPLAQLTSDEHDVLAQVAQGRSDAHTALRIGITEEQVGHHIHSAFTKLRRPESGTHHHRVLAILAYLEAR